MAKSTIASLEARIEQLESLVKALSLTARVVHRPDVEPVGTYPHTDHRGRQYRNAGNGVRAYAPAPSTPQS